jgi:hypothetical protein
VSQGTERINSLATIRTQATPYRRTGTICVSEAPLGVGNNLSVEDTLSVQQEVTEQPIPASERRTIIPGIPTICNYYTRRKR